MKANVTLIPGFLSMQGDVTVSFASPSIPTQKGPRVLIQAAALTYRKQLDAIPVITTASEYA